MSNEAIFARLAKKFENEKKLKEEMKKSTKPTTTKAKLSKAKPKSKSKSTNKENNNQINEDEKHLILKTNKSNIKRYIGSLFFGCF